MPSDLTPFFRPQAVAVIGASPDTAALPGMPLVYLKKQGFAGRLYPVNPKYRDVQGLPCFSSILQLPEPVDVALVIVGAGRTLEVMGDCAQRGVRYAISFGAGFAETGEAGAELQAGLGRIARETGMRIIGPNCLGSWNVRERIPLGFASTMAFSPRAGGLGYVSQSGAFLYGSMTVMEAAGLGFSYVCNTGNEADLTASEVLEWLVEDPDTRLLAAYIEQVRDPERFLRAADRALELGKPLVVLKSGRSERGRQAAVSHTASLAGSEEAFRAVARAHGIVYVQDLDQLVDALAGLAPGRYPDGTGVGIVTTSGALGILMTDALDERGLSVPDLHEETVAEVRQVIPTFASAANPVDTTAQIYADETLLPRCLAALEKDPNIAMNAVMFSTVMREQAARMGRLLVDSFRAGEKPMAVVITADPALAAEARQEMQAAGLPIFQSPSRAAYALATAHQYAQYRLTLDSAVPSITRGPAVDLFRAQEILEGGRGDGALAEVHVKAMLEAYGIPVTRRALAASAAEAVELAAAIGYPVALKVQAANLPHKTDAGAVRLGLQREADVRKAYAEVVAAARRHQPDLKLLGVLVEEMAPDGVDCFVGVKRDPQWGPMVLFGLGGIFVEVLRDIDVRPAPLSLLEAREMVRSVKGYPILAGARGGTPADLEALARVLTQVGRLAAELNGHLQELDINPLRALPRGCLVLDAAAVLP